MQISKMMVQATRSFLLLLSTAALLCHCIPASKLEAKEEAKLLNAFFQRLQIMQDASPSPPPLFGDEVLGQASPNQHSIRPDRFSVGDTVTYHFLAPETGRVYLDLLDDDGNNVILHVDARYDWSSSRNTLVLNTFQNGAWQTEARPTGFDFSPNTAVTVMVRAKETGFSIFTGKCETQIALFPYRSGLSVESVSRIRVTSEGNEAAKSVNLGICFNNQP